MKTFLDNKITHIILTNKKTNLIGKKQILELNINLKKLKNNLISNFFLSNNLKYFLGKNFSKSGNIFVENGFYFYKDICIFNDHFSYFLESEQILKNENIKYFFINYGLNFFFFKKENYLNFSKNFSQYISFEIYQLIFEIVNSEDFKIFFQKKYLGNNFQKYQKIVSKIKIKNYPKNHEIFIIKNNKIKKVFIKDFSERYNSVPKELIQRNLKNSQKGEIKIDFGFGKPVCKIYNFKNENSSGFGYGTVYKIEKSEKIFSEKIQNFGTGYSFFDKKLAKIKSFAEGIERYNSGCCWEGHEIGVLNVILRKKFIGNNFNENQDFLLTKIHQIYSDEKTVKVIQKPEYIPKELVYYPFFDRKIGFFANSSGIGAGRSYEEAFLGGLLELSERDSLMLIWLLKLTPNIISKNTLPKCIQKRICDLENFGSGEITVFDISFDKTIPNVLIFYKYKNSELFFCGASANINGECAILKALEEVEVNVYFTDKKINKVNAFEEVIDVSDHRYFYCQNGNFGFLDFLFDGNEKISFDNFMQNFEQNKTINEVVMDFEKISNGKFFIKNLTTKYSQKLGIYVLRVLSEGFIPIWFGHNSILPLNKERLNNELFQSFQKNKVQNIIPDFLHFFD